MRTSLTLCPLGLLSACGASEPVRPADRSPGGNADNVERIADHAGCDDPRPWADHLTPSAESRGIDITLGSTPSAAHFHGFQTGVIAEDIDQDNDIDLVFWDGEEQLHLLLNDGGGNFEPSELPPAPSRENGQYLRAAAAGDIDGDGLPELLWVGDGIALVSVNLGAGAFADWQTVIAQMGTQLDGYAAAAFGDIDGDDDLDVILAGLDARTAGASLPFNTTDWVASPDRILQNEGGTLVAGPTLVQFAGANLSLVQTITDRDLDGDVDLLSWADRADAMPDAPAAAFWRNDGGALINDAMDIGADTIASAMGAGIADLNEDGRPDYCVTDISDRLTCLMSDGNGAYYEGAAALGLEVQRTAHPAWPGPDNIRDVYTGWGLQLVDLDNDGFLDAASTGSVVSMTLDLQQPVVSAFQPHWLWRGTAAGTFESDWATEFFEGATWAWGMASADLDGDGARELIAATWTGRPEVWDNPCTSGRSLDISLRDDGPNPHAIGATVTVRDGTRTWQHQIESGHGGAQNPAMVHFGLGNRREVEAVTVTWPGGRQSVHRAIQTGGHVRIRRP